MPVKLTQTLGLQLHDGSSNGLGDGEVLRVDLAQGSAVSGNRLALVLVRVENVRAVALQSTLGGLLQVLADSAIQNVGELGGDLVENSRVDTKVLGQDITRGVGDPVVHHESSSIWSADVHGEGVGSVVHSPDFLKVTVVESEEVLVLIVQSLDVVGNTLGEIPDVTGLELLGGKATVLVNAAEKKRAVVDETPFRHSVPVQLANSTFLQMLLGPGNIVALGQILDDLLARPATGEQSGLRLRETPLDIGHEAIVSGRGAKLIRDLEVDLLVGAT